MMAQCDLPPQSNDPCVRGAIIAFCPDDRTNVQGETRFDHILWMIRNNPVWTGFLIEPYYALAPRISRKNPAEYATIREAWLEQTGPSQPRAIVLHNAAMFFAIREPEIATDLLRRAIKIDPDEPLYVERLGLVYGYAQIAPEGLTRFGVAATPERESFAKMAREEMLRSENWVLLAGARVIFDVVGACMGCDGDPAYQDKRNPISARMGVIKAEREPPSQTAPYQGTGCNGKSPRPH